ncbi:unnamed protein product [Rhizophagus irregularis]|nr:unnamed protein product [Rhizophagus irregularis]
MDERFLIELLEDLASSQNDDGQKRDILLERCLNASEMDMDEFLDELSRSFDTYLSTLQTFIFNLCNKNLRATPNFSLNRWNNSLNKFSSMLINDVVMKNLQNSDVPGFRELLHNCIELLWRTDNKDNRLTTKHVFSAILDANEVFGVLITETYGHHCIKRILFDFNMLIRIEQEELLKAADVVATLVEKCSEHEDVPSRLSEGFSIYKACTALLETLRSHQSLKQILLVNRKNSLPPTLDDMVRLEDKESRTQHSNRKRAASNINNNFTLLSIEDEQNLALLNMPKPQRPSDLPHTLRALELRKIDSFRILMEFLPCTSCHKQALAYFSPDKYFLEEESSSDCLYRLPFEFNEDDKLGPWDIMLSEDTIKDLRQLESSPDKFRTVIQKLGQISLGKWDKHELRRKVQTHAIPVYEIEIPDNDGLKILWQVDYGFSIRSDSLTQLVKIWAVTANKEQIHKILENLSVVHQIYTPKHLCMVEQTGKDSVILPMTFGNEEEIKSPENGLHTSLTDDEKLLEVHRMLVTNKFVPLSKNLYKSLALGGFNFTFQVSKKEYEIINCPASAVVIGRSGTGKTTCIIFRQIASYLNRQLCKTSSNDRVFIKRQIFITVSPNLRDRVKEYFNKLRESAMLAGKKISMAQFYEYRRKKEEAEADGTDTMLEEGDDDDDIPNSFHELEDHHFPLFITYDKFSKMLQETYAIKNLIKQRKLGADNIDSYDKEGRFYQKSSFVKTTNFVDYKVFQKRYWRRLSCDFDCELVYAEFSIIKGSNPEVDFLSREDYKNISTKKYPVFSYNRDQIYDLFQKYETMKIRNGDYDSIDRTLAILRLAKKKALGGPHIHEVYIDECQDNQIVDLALILKVFDRANSVFLAGDIAQCIARGSSFRFQDLHALMYNWERTRAKTNHSSIINPKQFELDINYRSHNGILQLATSVIDLIWRFFPNSIDRLSREHGRVGGPQPTFFEGFQKEHFKIFSSNSRESELDDVCTSNGQKLVNGDENPFIEFGADQVIIVRDDNAKDELKKLINKAGLVMTIFEAKGMEFNDVLLYNFFNDSPACRKWRVIDSIPRENSEVTRARQHIWICDENPEYSIPLKMYWERLGLIKVTQSVDEIISTLAKKSNSDEWDQQGKNFFEQRQYEQAIFCFEKSGNKKSRELANAYYLQQIAKDSTNDSDDDTIKSNFICAAEAFEKCSRPNQAASCYQDISMYKEAGDVYVKWNMFDPAARCYNKASMWYEAGKYFEKAKNYTDAVVAYKNDNRYEKVIELMRKYRQKIDDKIFHRITRLVNIHYRRANNKEMSTIALSILPQEEQIKLLRDHAPEEFLEVCEKTGQYSAVAEDLRSHGEFEKAADKFNCSNNGEDKIEALECLLHLCRVNVLKSIIINFSNSELISLLSKAIDIFTKIDSSFKSSKKWEKIMEEFQLYSAYLNKDLNRVNKYIQLFKNHGEIAHEFRAIILWLLIPQLDIEAEYWKNRLQHISRICDLVFPFVTASRYNDNKIIEKIFFVSEVENCPQKRQIFFDNPLVHLINEMNGNYPKKEATETTDNRYVYNVYTVYRTISKFLASHIFELMWSANQKGRNIPDISSQICFNRSCPKQNCKNHHVITTPSILHKRLELSFLQYAVMLKLIVLYHLRLLKEGQSKEVLGLQRRWAENLIRNHIRHHSSRTSCPEITHMMINKLPYHTRNGIIELAHNKWLYEFDNASNFEAMLKCMLVLQQLRDEWGINAFYWIMSQPINLLYPNNLPIGFEFCDYYMGYPRAIPVGKRLSVFFFYLRSHHVIEAISHIKIFIQYAIDNTQGVNLIKPDSFGDLVFLMEFVTSLIFATSPRCCDFFLSRAYLVNYFDRFTAIPLIPNLRRAYNRENYLAAIMNSIDQIRQLLSLLIYKEQTHFTIIIRLIRLLVLIGLNESTCSSYILNLFKYLDKKFSSSEIKKFDHRSISDQSYIISKYLEQKTMGLLVNVLHKDLKETGCDSLVIVYYQLEGIPSKFSDWEKHGIIKLAYNSIEGFRSALQQIKSPVNIVENVVSENHSSKNSSLKLDTFEQLEQLAISEEVKEPETEIQAWFRKIHDSPEAKDAAIKIQVWIRQVYKRAKSRTDNDTTLDEIYNDMMIFCQAIMKEKGKKAVNKYIILLRGWTVDVIVKLIKLQGRMGETNNQLKKTINSHSSDTNKIDRCLELEDELRYKYYEKVELALKSLSITENSQKHKKLNFGWLENELYQAEDIINQVWEWINECKKVVTK